MHTKILLRRAAKVTALSLLLAPILTLLVMVAPLGPVAAEEPAPPPIAVTPEPAVPEEAPAPAPEAPAEAPDEAAEEPQPLAAAQEGYLNVIGTVPLEGEAIAQQIVLFFDAPVTVPPQEDGSAPAPFTIDPPVAGEFRVEKNYIAFKSGAFQPGKLYRITLPENLQSGEGQTLNPEQRVLAFSSFVFRPQNIWTLESGEGREVIGVSFPSAMNPEHLKAHLTVAAPDGSPLPYTTEAGTEASIVRVIVENAPGWPIQLQFSPGLTDATGSVTMAEAQTLQYPAQPELTVEAVNWGDFEPERQTFRMNFSRPVDPTELSEHLSVKHTDGGAEVPFTVSAEPEGSQTTRTVELHLDTIDAVKLTVEVSSGLTGQGHTELREAYSTQLNRQEEPLRIDETWWGQDERTGLKLMVRLSNAIELQELQQHVKLTPELPELRVERQWGETFGITGVWDSNKAYRLEITPGLKFGDVGALKNPVTYDVTSEKVPNYLGFGHEGKFYFPRQGGLSLPLESRNLTKAKLNLYQLFPSNIVIALQQMSGTDNEAVPALSWSKPLGSRDIDLAVRKDRLVDTPVNLNTAFPDKTGVFILQAEVVEEPRSPEPSDESEGEDEYYYSYTPGPNSKLVLMTQMGMLAHWRDRELALFVHDLYSLAPLPLAKVTVYSDKNQVLGQGNTDDRGMLHLEAFDPSLGVPFVAVAEREGDYTFLELRPREDDLKAFEPDLPAYNKEGYDAFLYADRELYRPGELVHLRWLVRKEYGVPLKNVPLIVTVVKPNGRNLVSKPTVLSAFGTGELDLQTQRVYSTGLYTVRLSVPGNETPIGTYTFHLEDFVPNRMKTAVTAPEGVWVAGNDYTIGVNGQHLFGAPAADRRVETLVTFRREGFKSEAWKEFTFNNDSTYQPEYVSLGEDRTDEEGNASFVFNYEPPQEVTFPLKAVVIGRVFELGGRAVVDRQERTLFPSPVALGVAATPPADGKGVEVFVAAVNADETPAGLTKAKVTLERQIWNYYVRRYYSHYESNWAERFEPVETRDVDLVNGRGSVVFPFDDYGYYRIRVHSDETPQFSTLSFYAYGGQYQVVDSARPSLVKIATDKPEYNVGDEAVIRIESPFDGHGIVVIQGEELQQMLPVEIVGGVGELRLPVGAEQFPNVWIEATIVHTVKTDRTQVYPFSSFAMANLTVREPRKQLAVTFPGLPEEIRPLSPLTVPIEVKDHAGQPVVAEVTVAAVDEGIHSITGYKNPDPYGWLGRARRPDFRRAHYYDKVVYDFSPPAPGGDMGNDLAKRASAVEENWIRPVALWSGSVVTDESGRASVTFDVPEFNGQLRIVAVAAAERALGAAGEDVFVRRPYILHTSMPRFLLPGDTAFCRGTVFNNTDAPVKITVNWSVGGAIADGQGKKTLDVPAHKEASFTAPITAGEAVGQGEIRWTTVAVNAKGKELERFQETDLLPVRPPAAYESAHDLVVLNPGESRTLKNERFLDDARASIEMTVSASPALRLKDALRYVVHYPYGCVEQTTSALLPMYLLKQNEALLASTLERNSKLKGYLEAGISRLFSMQTPGGGLAMWPGGGDPYPYGSVYALHFLTLVKNGRDFDVPEESFQLLQNYVRTVAMDWNSGDAQADLYRRAYATYVLALGGDMEAIRQIERFDAVTLPTAARYLLAAALAQNTKDSDRVKLYLEQAPHAPYETKEQGGTLNSDIRNKAVRLLALQQMGTNPEEVAQLANELVEFLAGHRYGNTQETAFIVSSLAGYLSGLAGDVSTAAATISGGKTGAIKGTEFFSGKLEGKGVSFTVANTGQAPIFVSLTSEGVPAEMPTEVVKEGMSVERHFRTNRGEAYEGNRFLQGDSYVVEIALTCDGQYENVVVTDLLPPGFEIENPRLDPNSLSGEEFQNAVTPTHLEIRDDRLVLAFDQLASGTHKFFYVVRAVTTGQFTHPPLAAECMYDARFRARNAPGTAEVTPR